MPGRVSKRQIEEEDRHQLRRQLEFRRAADVVATALAAFPEVARIALIGSVGRPLVREVPRFAPFRRHGVAILHECKDVDLAIWVDRIDGLAPLNRARSRSLNAAQADGVQVAHHQVEVFLLRPCDDAYLGRLCTFGTCPKGNADCIVPGCGQAPFLRQHRDFAFWPDALEGAVTLYIRGLGLVMRAGELPRQAVA